MFKTLRDKLDRMREGYKTGGFEYLLYAIPSYFPAWLVSYSHQRLIFGEKLRLFTRQYKSYTVRFACLQDAAKLEWPDGYTAERVEYRLKRGDTGVLVLRDDKLVAMSWASTGKKYVRYNGWIWDTGDDGIFLDGLFTLPEERLKGFAAACLRMQEDHYKSLNRTKKYGAVDVLNESSLEMHKRMGFKVVGDSRFITFLGVSICHYRMWPNPVKRFQVFVRKPPHNLDWV